MVIRIIIPVVITAITKAIMILTIVIIAVVIQALAEILHRFAIGFSQPLHPKFNIVCACGKCFGMETMTWCRL